MSYDPGYYKNAQSDHTKKEQNLLAHPVKMIPFEVTFVVGEVEKFVSTCDVKGAELEQRTGSSFERSAFVDDDEEKGAIAIAVVEELDAATQNSESSEN